MDILDVHFLEWNYLFVFLVSVSIGRTDGSYSISNDKSGWNTHNESCTLATPKLTLTTRSSGITLSEDAELQSVVDASDGNVWIGYYVAFTGFQYVGCVYKDDMKIDALANISTNKLGLCYMACNYTDYVGVTFKKDALKCYCGVPISSISTNILTKTNCDKNCKEGNNDNKFTCGKSNGDNVSVYKSTGEVRASFGKSRCLSVKNNSQTLNFTWGNCIDKKIILCQNESERVKAYSDTKSWTETQRECFNNKMFPVSAVNVSTESPISSSEHWTGNARSIVVYKYPRSLILTNTYRKYLYIDRTNMSIKRANNITAMLKTLCVSSDSTTSATTTTKRPSTSDSSDTSTSFGHVTSTTGTTIARTDNGHPADAHRADDKGSSTIGAVSGGVVAAVLVIVVIVALLLLRHRGVWPFQRSKSPPEHQTSPGHVNPSYIDGGEMDTVSETNANHNYFDLEKDTVYTNGVKPNSPKALSTPVHHVFEKEDQQYTYIDNGFPANDPDYCNTGPEYNTVFDNKRQNPQGKTENLYNNFVTDDDSMYNVTDKNVKAKFDDPNGDYNTTTMMGNGKTNQWQTDNVYNHLGPELKSVISESDYDTTAVNGVKGNTQRQQTTDDVYNHIDTQRKAVVNQPAYDTTCGNGMKANKQIEQTTDNVYNTLDRNNQEYSHIRHGDALNSNKFADDDYC